MRCRRAIQLVGAVGRLAAALTIMSSLLSHAEALKPTDALERYLAARPNEQAGCADSLFAVQIDASLPALKKTGRMTGFKRMAQPVQPVYRGLRFTGDRFVKTQVIARFLAHDTDSRTETEQISVTPANYVIAYEGISAYNGLTAYVFLLRPRRKRAGLFHGELWLDADTAAPVRLWGDLVKSPSIFVRSFRFVQDYQTIAGCAEPLRLLVTAHTRIVGTVEMTVWTHPASAETEDAGGMNSGSDFSMEANRHNEHNYR